MRAMKRIALKGFGILLEEAELLAALAVEFRRQMRRPWIFGEGRQRAIVHFDDLPRLDEEEYMNDSLIDFYMM